MKKLHLIYIPFTGLGIKEYGGDEWYQYRANLFRDYTLKSLTAQTDRNFTIWISFRPQEKENPITKQIENDIKKTGLDYIFTFDGIMMHDDRGVWHNTDLEQRMEKSLNELKEHLGYADWVFKTDLGSDDMFHREAIREIKAEEPRPRGATYYLNGYILNMTTGQLAQWNRNTSCSKYTIIYPYETFFNAKKHLEHIKGLISHEYTPLVFDATRLPDGRYMCGVHEGNISTTWENKFRGDEFFGDEKNNILRQFGL